MTPTEHQQICDLLAAIGTEPTAKAQLKALLAQLRRSWNDLAEIVRPSAPEPSHLAAVTERDRKQIRDRFAHMGADGNEGDNAERKLKTLLGQVKLSWSDIPWLIQPALKDLLQSAEAPPPLAVLVTLIDRYVAFPLDYVSLVVALWAMHTHIYERYSVTPRLLLTSPVRGCGKTTLMRVLERLVARAERCDNITAAAIYSAIDEDRSTLLLDEADNLNVAAKGALQAVLHAGFQQGGSIARMVRGGRKRYNVFAPIALAAIGTAWSSLPLLSRSIVIRMRRHDGSFKLRRLDPEDTRDLDAGQRLRSRLDRTRRDLARSADAGAAGRPPQGPLATADRNRRCERRGLGRACESGGGRPQLAIWSRTLAWCCSIISAWCSIGWQSIASRARSWSPSCSRSILPTVCSRSVRARSGPPRKLTDRMLAAMLKPVRHRTRRRCGHRAVNLADEGPRGYLREDFEDAWASLPAIAPIATPRGSARCYGW